MDKVQDNVHLPNHGSGANDRRRRHLTRMAINVARSRWLAMFAIAFAVSWSFHQVDEIGQHRLERQQRITQCTIKEVAFQQSEADSGMRIAVKPILQQCEKQAGK
jgi:hypothetical protein